MASTFLDDDAILESVIHLPVSVPPFFAEACGYRGSARFVAVRWDEQASALWLSDDGHVVQAPANAMITLWRRPGGRDALQIYRAEIRCRARPPWLVIDRERHQLGLGCALTAWRLVEGQYRRGAGRSSDADDAPSAPTF